MRYLPGIPRESTGAIPVNVQDQHSRAVDLSFTKQLADTTITVQADPDDTTLTLASTTGFVDGVVVFLTDGAGLYTWAEQVGAPAGSVITLDRPIDRTFPSTTPAYAANKNMNVDGSSTTQIFQIGLIGTNFEIDITRVLGIIQTNSAMDDSLFGDIAGLTNGLQLRVNNGVMENLWNVKTNGELALVCYDFTYSDRAPAGKFGARFRSTYAGQEKHGVTLRLQVGDTLELLVQDNLSTLDILSVVAQGHFVID